MARLKSGKYSDLQDSRVARLFKWDLQQSTRFQQDIVCCVVARQ